MKYSTTAYNAYIVMGKPDGVVDHLRRRKKVWTLQSAVEEAKTYPDRWSFQKGSGSAYKLLWRNNLLDSVFGPLPERASWDEVSVRKAASECKHGSDFKIKYGGAHKWAYKNGILKELFGVDRNTPECDNDVVYVWSVLDRPGLYKIGKTSKRLGIRRISYSCKKGNLVASKIWLFYTDDAKSLEKELLSFGKPYEFDYKFSGSTEFRTLSDSELQQCLALCERKSSSTEEHSGETQEVTPNAE